MNYWIQECLYEKEDFAFLVWDEKHKKLYEVSTIEFDKGWVWAKSKKDKICLKLEKVILLPYIGAKDKNGKKIFDRHVVKYIDHANRPRIGVIMQFGYQWMVVAVDGDEEGNQDIELHPDYLKRIEIIGHAFTHPELLEVEDDED